MANLAPIGELVDTGAPIIYKYRIFGSYTPYTGDSIYIDQTEIWHGRVHHARQFWGELYAAVVLRQLSTPFSVVDK